MTTTNGDPRVAYSKRMRLSGPSGTAIIWPFIDHAPGLGPIEFVLDNNVLTDLSWLVEAKDAYRGHHLTISPWLALVEQWLSNPKFRQDPEDRIAGFLTRFRQQGIKFSDNFEKTQADRLRRNDAQLRYQHAITFGYIAVTKKVLDWQGSDDEVLRRLADLSNADVPRLSGCLILATLALFLRKKQSLRLADDNKAAMSFLRSFFAYQPGKKDEPDYISRAYLRNRAGDLTLWYALPLLLEQGVNWQGEPAIVTKDKALYRLIFRLIPPVLGSGRTIQFAPAFNELPEEDWPAWYEIVMALNFKFQIPSNSEKLKRLENLFAIAKDWCSLQVEKDELDAAFAEWIEPGEGMELTL